MKAVFFFILYKSSKFHFRTESLEKGGHRKIENRRLFISNRGFFSTIKCLWRSFQSIEERKREVKEALFTSSRTSPKYLEDVYNNDSRDARSMIDSS